MRLLRQADSSHGGGTTKSVDELIVFGPDLAAKNREPHQHHEED
jgi:hypothetical protein